MAFPPVAARGAEVRAALTGRRVGGGAWDLLSDNLDAATVFAPMGALVPVALRDIDKGGTVALAGISMTDLPAMPMSSISSERRRCRA